MKVGTRENAAHGAWPRDRSPLSHRLYAHNKIFRNVHMSLLNILLDQQKILKVAVNTIFIATRSWLGNK